MRSLNESPPPHAVLGRRGKRGPVAAAGLLAVALIAPAGRTQSIVLPPSALTTPGNGEDPWLLYGAASAAEARVQYLFDAAGLPATSGTVRSMRVRRATSVQVVVPATTVDLDLTLSRSAVPWVNASAAFAANSGAGAVHVFSGRVSLPLRGPSSPPAPWEAPIPFAMPFTHGGAGSGSLVLEAVARHATSSWLVEAVEGLPGSRATEWDPSQCRHSGGSFNNQLGFQVPTVGGAFWVDHYGLPANVPSFAMSVVAIGGQGIGGSYGGIRLPFSPGAYGVPTRPGCQLAIDVLQTVKVTYVRGGSSGALVMPHVAVPAVAAFAGAVFYTQPLSIDTDPISGARQLYTGWANRWTVGPVGGAPVATVVSAGNASATTGAVYLGCAAVVRLDP